MLTTFITGRYLLKTARDINFWFSPIQQVLIKARPDFVKKPQTQPKNNAKLLKMFGSSFFKPDPKHFVTKKTVPARGHFLYIYLVQKNLKKPRSGSKVMNNANHLKN